MLRIKYIEENPKGISINGLTEKNFATYKKYVFKAKKKSLTVELSLKGRAFVAKIENEIISKSNIQELKKELINKMTDLWFKSR